jgi:hypothetical protein
MFTGRIFNISKGEQLSSSQEDRTVMPAPKTNTSNTRDTRAARKEAAAIQREAFKYRQEDKALEKEQKRQERELKKNVKREIALLKFMLKTDVQYYHHGKNDSLKNDLERALKTITESNSYQEYNGYAYLIQEGNYMSRALLGHQWTSSEFKSIYDVPLDGSYVIYCYDSGARGLGTFHYMSAKRAEVQIEVPKVNPGAFRGLNF